MTKIIEWLFSDKVVPALWALMMSNVLLAWSIILVLIGYIVIIYKNIKGG